MLRVVMIPAFMILLYFEYRNIALIVFIVASITDFVDGYIARRYHQITDFGKFMDPLADKLLVTSAMVWFVEMGMMPAWVLLLVIAREFSVTGLRLIAVDQGRVIAAGFSGKVKTASTMVAICLMLLPIPTLLSQFCVLVILLTTVYSGVEYFIVNRDVFQDKT
jgi:CDP-diacylglycerol--glycerol-3-phosphate 3-phosphatidyltransferase